MWHRRVHHRAALIGYDCVGLSWDVRNQEVAKERAAICGADRVEFPIQDARTLDERTEYNGKFDIVLCLENAEHIINDRKLLTDMQRCMKPGGLLFLTTPNYFYRPMTRGDDGPFSKAEDGWHVRRGYTVSMLRELADLAGFQVEEIGYCSGFFSQKVTAIARLFSLIGLGMVGWALTFPLRVLPVLFDRLVERLTGYPGYSICIVLCKPRYQA